jgi:hypothetical protein
VLRGQCAPQLLHTYSQERQVVAQELIDFDREWAQMFSDRAKEAAEGGAGGVDPKEFQRYFERHGRFTAGMGTHYRPSAICGEATHQRLATGFVIGTRFHSAPVVRAADARPFHLGHAGKADGRWRLYAFAGAEDLANEQAGVRALCRYLTESPESPVRRFTPPGQDIDAVFDLRAIFQQGHRELAIESMPALLLPRKGKYGLVDYDKVFCPDLKDGPDIFDCAASTASRARWWWCARPVHRARAAAARARRAGAVFQRLHAGAVKPCAPTRANPCAWVG